MSDITHLPTRIHINRQSGSVEITWPDLEGHLHLSEIRRACPCALCDDLRAQQTQKGGLDMIAEVEMPSAVLTDIVPVGNYALQFRWQDGHDTGIYTYAYLRELVLESVGTQGSVEKE